MAGDARSGAPSDNTGDGRPGARERVPGRGLDPIAAVQAVPEPRYPWRRTFAFLFCSVLGGVAIFATYRADSAQAYWIAIAAICGMLVVALLYMDATKAADLARIVGAFQLFSGRIGLNVPSRDETEGK